MRRLRRLLLVAIGLLVAAVGLTYWVRRTVLEQQTPAPAAALPQPIQAEGRDWVYTHHEGDRPRVELRAARMRQIAEPAEFQLEGVELRIFDAGGQSYDHVKSAFARFDTKKAELYSDGEVEITLGLPVSGARPENAVVIRSSGVRFDTTTGKAVTDRPTSFRYGRAEGRSRGASFDPAWNDLRMLGGVDLRWHPERPGQKLIEVQAGELIYKQDQDRVYLAPWSRLKRGHFHLEAADSVVTLENNELRRVEAAAARGRDRYPARSVEFSARRLIVEFQTGAAVQKVVGQEGAQMVAISSADRTRVESREIFLDFQIVSGESLLESALAMGGSVLESEPLPRGGKPPAETRLVRAEVIKTVMRPGGGEIAAIETHTPGVVEFLPNSPEQRKRRIEAERLWLHFAEGNRIETFRATQVATRTEPRPTAERPGEPTITSSQDLVASFDAATGDLLNLQQWGDFRYQEGGRRAAAEQGTLDEARKTIALSGKARLWDETGSTAADELFLEQTSGNLTATGRVRTTGKPGPEPGSGLLESGEAVHAAAGRMIVTRNRTNVVYEGEAVLWQGANRLEAPRIEIDRAHRLLYASGGVLTRFLEKPTSVAAHNGPAAPVYLTVRAAELLYVEQDRLAHYRGGVRFRRGPLEVAAKELRAWFSASEPTGSQTTLERALAEGGVRIVETRQDRTRTGTGESADYLVPQEKILLRGRPARLADSARGATEGEQLIYFAGDDRLLVEGGKSRPAVTRLRRH